jgi:hypothetical protein
MKALPAQPSLYQINTRVSLTELSKSLGRSATQDDIPDAELDHLVAMGFDWVWFLSVWQTGLAGQRISRANPDFRGEFQETLPDLREEDMAGSGFAITGYSVHKQLGGDQALLRLRKRLHQRGLRLMLDFVPNHTGLDHPWVKIHPEYYIQGTQTDLTRAPQNYTWVKRTRGDLLFAHGRDPYFPGWPDTLQLDYSNPATQEAMMAELVKIGASVTACAATRRCWCYRTCSSVHGVAAPICSGLRQLSEFRKSTRTSVSWPRFIGTWNGRCSNRGSITLTINGFTTVSARGTRDQCESTFRLALTIRTSWPAFWKTMTSPAPPPPSPPA